MEDDLIARVLLLTTPFVLFNTYFDLLSNGESLVKEG